MSVVPSSFTTWGLISKRQMHPLFDRFLQEFNEIQQPVHFGWVRNQLQMSRLRRMVSRLRWFNRTHLLNKSKLVLSANMQAKQSTSLNVCKIQKSRSFFNSKWIPAYLIRIQNPLPWFSMTPSDFAFVLAQLSRY